VPVPPERAPSPVFSQWLFPELSWEPLRGLSPALEVLPRAPEPSPLQVPWQARETLPGLPEVAFHLRHIARSLDRLLTYAEGRGLGDE